MSTIGGRVKTVVRSSTEAEISAVNEIVSELLWRRDVMEELGNDQLKMPIMENNLSYASPCCKRSLVVFIRNPTTFE